MKAVLGYTATPLVDEHKGAIRFALVRMKSPLPPQVERNLSSDPMLSYGRERAIHHRHASKKAILNYHFIELMPKFCFIKRSKSTLFFPHKKSYKALKFLKRPPCNPIPLSSKGHVRDPTPLIINSSLSRNVTFGCLWPKKETCLGFGAAEVLVRTHCSAVTSSDGGKLKL